MLYNIVLVSAVQKYESAISILTSFPPEPPSHPTPFVGRWLRKKTKLKKLEKWGKSRILHNLLDKKGGLTYEMGPEVSSK